MILARLAVYGAIASTLWFNGSYAFSRGGTPLDQAALVAVAVTVDLAKCSFLSAASALLRARHWLAALLLFLIWCPSLAFSTFAGYSYITGNRAAATADREGSAQERVRAQATYDRATTDIATAKKSPMWEQSAACTNQLPRYRPFCEAISNTKAEQAAAATILNRITPLDANPEVRTIVENTGLTLSQATLIIGLVPALILELAASVGFYAVNRSTMSWLPRTPLRERLHEWLLRHSRPSTNAPAARPDASQTMQGASMRSAPAVSSKLKLPVMQPRP